MQIIEQHGWGAWVTPKLLRERPIHRWYVYPHSYDKQLVLSLLHSFEIGEDGWVWDPFLGAGTTLLACRELGCPSIGTDLLPLSILVTRAKTATYEPRLLVRQLERFRFEPPKGTRDRFAPIPIVRRALSSTRRRQISYLLNQIDRLPPSPALFFRTVLLHCVEDLALAKKSGGWLRIVEDADTRGQSLPDLFRLHAEHMLDDLRLRPVSHSRMRIKLGDARTVTAEHPIAACITSPPYLNRHDYTRVFALELALTGIASSAELVRLRYRTLRSHVEAKPPRGRSSRIPLPAVVAQITEAIDSAGPNNCRITAMVTGYFEDMQMVLANIARNLQPGGSAALVIGNTRFSGVMIPVDEILMAIGPRVGLEPYQMIVTRHRGNSAQQMGTYGRDPARESVLVFKKPR
jgi:hypothetical protein